MIGLMELLKQGPLLGELAKTGESGLLAPALGQSLLGAASPQEQQQSAPGSGQIDPQLLEVLRQIFGGSNGAL